MNVPNQLTVARLGLTALFVVLLSIPEAAYARTLALLTFGVAAFTDFLDGHLARKHSLITNFGKLMDPLADKVLMTSGYVMLVGLDLVPAWVVVAILGREFLVTGIRLLATSQGKVLAAEKLGKHKTTWQIVTLIYFLTFLASGDPLWGAFAAVFQWPPAAPEALGRLLIGASLVLTIWSGLSFAWNSRQVLRDETDVAPHRS